MCCNEASQSKWVKMWEKYKPARARLFVQDNCSCFPVCVCVDKNQCSKRLSEWEKKPLPFSHSATDCNGK